LAGLFRGLRLVAGKCVVLEVQLAVEESILGKNEPQERGGKKSALLKGFEKPSIFNFLLCNDGAGAKLEIDLPGG